jgi:mevalonate kinase
MKVYAPGKLILSGEHAVIYGMPALAMAVNRYATATVTREILPHISFHLADLAHRSRLSLGSLQHLKARIKRKYHRFIRGEYTIAQVLHKPFELAQFALGVFAESLNFSLPHGVKIHMQSDIPIGCGMGSSAATILCVLHAVSNYLKVPLSSESLYQLALQAENMQHGQSSGLDLRVAIQGGCVFMHAKKIQTRSIPTQPLFIVHTGTPQTSTGQCVEHTARLFQSTQLLDDFAAVTHAMDDAFQQQSSADIKSSIRHNHRLLASIGVVPSKVQEFIAEVEGLGGAAKICGAGAVSGNNAGVVLTVIEEESLLNDVCSRFGYELTPVSGVCRGVHAV